jgi:hypothetical protein
MLSRVLRVKHRNENPSCDPPKMFRSIGTFFLRALGELHAGVNGDLDVGG